MVNKQTILKIMMKPSFYLTAFAVLALTATSCDNNIETEQFIEAPSIALKNTAGFCVLASSGGTATISGLSFLHKRVAQVMLH